VADYRILHCIREQQQNYEIEGRDLPKRSFSGQPQQNYEKAVNQNRAEDLLCEGDPRDEQIGEQVIQDHSSIYHSKGGPVRRWNGWFIREQNWPESPWRSSCQGASDGLVSCNPLFAAGARCRRA